MGEGSYGIDRDVLARIASEIKDVISSGVQLAVVIGGGHGSCDGRLHGHAGDGN